MATILFPFIGSCIKKIQELATDEAVLILGVKQELTELQRRMKQIQCFVSDAEQRSIQESAVSNWLGELRDAMYDADNIIDLARFKGSKLLVDNPSSSRKSTLCSGFSPLSCFHNIQIRHEIAVQIRSLNKRIEKISKDNIFLTLHNTAPNGEISVPNWRKRSHLVEPNLVGKEIRYSSKKLVELVLAHNKNKDYKLAIVGTGGVGKTTLAQKIYNDQKIKGNFKKHAWICVSQNYNEANILKEILRNFGVHEEQGETIPELQSKIAETIEGNSFFLVLDDMWQSNVWTNLLRTSLHKATAGVILATTRDDTFAMKIGAQHTHRVDLMSIEVGWELLWKSMGIDQEEEVQNLRNTGIEIIHKCGYLPLAIKVLASVLASKDQTENEWKKILSKSFTLSQSKLPDEIERSLYVSYNELPHHLKQCFLYCALFPEDATIVRDDIVRLWVAEGFVEEQQGQLSEETAEEYYYELIHRNLLQPDGSTFDHTNCKMHDLLRQLACYLSREECFVGDTELIGGQSMSKLRRLSIVTNKDMLVLPIVDRGNHKMRTLRIPYAVSQGVGNSNFKKLLHLRVLDLAGSSIQTIPDCIAKLNLLRLLDLNGTNISCLPESIGYLMNLQILNLQMCKGLHNLPLAITKLINLRRLGMDYTDINQVPKGIGKLVSLNDLEGFPIGGETVSRETQDGWNLEELRHLSNLRRLDLIKLERATTCSTDSLLIDKKYLKVLNLQCTKHLIESYSEEDVGHIEKIFEQLIPPHNLEDLLIVDFFGRKFPTWLGSTHLVSVKYLKLIDCNSCVHLPPLWQLPNLKYLRIEGAAAVTKIGPEFVGCRGDNPKSTVAVAFPRLESLVIRDMPNWEEWSFVEEGNAAAASMEGEEDGSAEIRKGEAPSPRVQVLPRLKRLELGGCPKLRALPRQLGQEATCLELLGLRGASSLKVVEDLPFLSEVLLISRCDDLERVSNLPRVGRLRVEHCPKLRCVEGLGSLRQLWLDEDMQEMSELWVSGLQRQCQKLHDEDLDVYDRA
ncbi:disease resistance RPP13-like protein 4 isoform X3 [Brachypodium distachyon]|uniref:AAA+ ATPase domain-containing protein n=1 Tax=Brachypodium distachyon TaxID=15368 RepID=I1IJE7_BRADI|nr:disease resistance RPP13-like protein 4 isoform X3 [Brachypodium distachyon]XP_024318583.1 disease resistance RPP13-like protein 4 isoform X3 [Brachypodium distachyon]XP_024318584.1 disease resistance RPP13-like protein 4 isoform X3 [Brachypodium distachyon]XP_024318585.1 disease resistance RPP13-like protein 4 isoform X3 [Brachypodium distachyon]XP_024318586.1 disease resistance RPP13-like protein 4 isoform X3 [Brachypodium distachyon]XP_024318587.1 disease resistance RPP13-like protein 4 |eukprot:XP_014758127.1 disease resistance RPP13-like protein 4 isoform X3 [Brachypodium distachyon]